MESGDCVVGGVDRKKSKEEECPKLREREK